MIFRFVQRHRPAVLEFSAVRTVKIRARFSNLARPFQPSLESQQTLHVGVPPPTILTYFRRVDAADHRKQVDRTADSEILAETLADHL